MSSEGLSSVCGGLGYRREDQNGTLLGYDKGDYCLDNLKDLQRFLRRDDPHAREVFKQICKWNVVSRDLIPLMENYQTDRNLVINGVKVLVFLTMPIDPASDSIAQQIEYLWRIKAAVTRNAIVGIIVSLLEDPLDHLERNTLTEDDSMLVQLVLTFFRNVLAIQEILSQHKASGSSTHFLHLRDEFLEILFQENVMDLVLALAHHINSSRHLRQDCMLFLEIFHYIFQGQEPKLVAESSQEQSEDIVIETSLNSLRDIMEEEHHKTKLIKLRNSAVCSRFNGTFTRVSVDGSRTLCKGNPTAASGKSLLRTSHVHRGPLKKIQWDKNLSGKRSKISSLLRNLLDQFSKGAYNVLMQSVYENIEKDRDGVQTSDVMMFYRVACFVTDFQHHRLSVCEPEFLKEDLCGPIAATMHEGVFSLVISKWRYAFETLKETNDYKFLSSSGSIMKSLIRMLDLALAMSPEDSKEHQTARILLYKLFYDQTDQGATHFLLNLIRSFDTHKQPKSDLADLVDIMYRFLKLMENLQQRGALRVSKKKRKGRKRKASREDRPAEEDARNEDATSCPGSATPIEDLDTHIADEPNAAADSDFLSQTKVNADAGEQNYAPEEVDSDDEHRAETNEVDFRVNNVLTNLANNAIVQRLCWLLKFYKSNVADVNGYVINLLQRISDDLELSPMLYQLSLLTIFYGILEEEKSSKCNEHAVVFDFLTGLVRRMFKKLKNQPLLFVELLLWKTRKECHCIDADSLLHDIRNLREGGTNSDGGGGGGAAAEAAAAASAGHSRSVADSLGEDDADALVSQNVFCRNAEMPVSVASPATADGVFPNGAVGLDAAPFHGRKRIRALSKEQEEIVRDLFEKFKDHRRCARMIADALDPSVYTAAQISRKLRQLGLRRPRETKPRKEDEEEEEKKPEDSEEEEEEEDGQVLATLLQRCKKSKRAESGPPRKEEEEGEEGEGEEEAEEEEEEKEEQQELGNDELADSGDELSFASAGVIPRRRKLRTVFDGDD